MSLVSTLPLPQIDARPLGAHRLLLLTDEALFAACGTRIAFTGRAGGVSQGPYASLNLGLHVNDDPSCVYENRARLLDALGAPAVPLVVPNQVHRTHVVAIESSDPSAVALAQAEADGESDALVVRTAGVAALLNFADCTPVIVVAPSGNFAIAHAGWRGAVAHVASTAARALIERECASAPEASYDEVAAGCNAYIGPHIQVECFETGEEVTEQFEAEFGRAAQDAGLAIAPDKRHVDLSVAVTLDLIGAGLAPARIFDTGICTKCHPDAYFSYRASGGVCGRHGAAAIRLEGDR